MLRRFVAALILCAPAFAVTAITGTFADASGNPRSGAVYLSWPAFVKANGTSVPAGSTSSSIVAGALSVALEPVDTSTSGGRLGQFYYTARYSWDTSKAYAWRVVTSGSPIDVTLIQTDLPSSGSAVLPMVAAAQIASGGAVTGQPLVWNGYSYAPGAVIGTGTVTNVAMTVPSFFTVTGSPIIGAGTLAITAATGQTANRFLATPSGSTGAVSLRAITTTDLPAIDLSLGVTGNLPVTNLNSGTSASSSTFWRGDGTWATPAGAGTVVGPGSSINTNIAGYNGTTGQVLYDTNIAAGNVVTATGTLTTDQLLFGGGTKTIAVGNLTGDATTSGAKAVTVVKVNGVAYSASPATNSVPVITASNTATYKALPTSGTDGCFGSTDVLKWRTSTQAFVCGTVSATGSVTSVGLTAPAFLSVAGSPITSSGTLALTLATQTANYIFAGPTTGSAAAPTFRAMVAADLPAGVLQQGNPAKDAAIGFKPGGGTHGAFLVSPLTDPAADYAVAMIPKPSAASVAVYPAVTTRTSNDTGVPTDTVEPTLKAVQGSGATFITADASLTDGCIEASSGKLVSTGSACGSGGGGSTSQGTAASIPGTCTTGELYFPTNSLYTVLRCSASNTWTYFVDGQTVTPPTGSWTWDNSTGGSAGGPATVDTTHKYWSLKFPNDLNLSTDISAYYFAAPSPSYTRTFMLRTNMATALQAGYQAWYVGFQESSTGKMVAFFASNDGVDNYRMRWGTTKFTTTTNLSPGDDVTYLGSASSFFSNNVWVRLTDNNTNLIFEVSFDGQFWNTVQTVSRTTHMSGGPNRLFVGGKNAVGGGVGSVYVNILGVY